MKKLKFSIADAGKLAAELHARPSDVPLHIHIGKDVYTGDCEFVEDEHGVHLHFEAKQQPKPKPKPKRPAAETKPEPEPVETLE